GTVWIASMEGVGCLDDDLHYRARTDLVEGIGCRAISSDHRGWLWFACDNCIVCYAPSNRARVQLPITLCKTIREYNPETMIVGCDSGLFSLPVSNTVMSLGRLAPIHALAATEREVGRERILSIY